MQEFEHFVIPRFTSLVNATGAEWGINEAYKELVANYRRNKLIIEDVEECVKNGRTPSFLIFVCIRIIIRLILLI